MNVLGREHLLLADDASVDGNSEYLLCIGWLLYDAIALHQQRVHALHSLHLLHDILVAIQQLLVVGRLFVLGGCQLIQVILAGHLEELSLGHPVLQLDVQLRVRLVLLKSFVCSLHGDQTSQPEGVEDQAEPEAYVEVQWLHLLRHREILVVAVLEGVNDCVSEHAHEVCQVSALACHHIALS